MGTPQRVAKSGSSPTDSHTALPDAYIVATRSITGIHWYLAIDATCASTKVIEAGCAFETLFPHAL